MPWLHAADGGCALADAQTLTLQDNYRSTPEVLVSAESMLADGLPVDDSAWLNPLRPSGASVEVSRHGI